MSSTDDILHRWLGQGGKLDELRDEIDEAIALAVGRDSALRNVLLPDGKGGAFFHIHLGAVTLTGPVHPCPLGDGWVAVGPPGDKAKKPVYVRLANVAFIAGPFDENPAEPSRLAVPTNLPPRVRG